MFLIDTHCHLDAPEFKGNQKECVERAVAKEVKMMVIPSVCEDNFSSVIELSQSNRHCAFALGIHPLYVNQSSVDDLNHLKDLILVCQKEAKPLVALGEIGLDYYVKGIDQQKQVFYFTQQLEIACQNQLPVILHVRGAIDDVIKHLRQYPLNGGIAHAFNGSLQQAKQLIDLGFKLGFGGAMTYTRAHKIRSLAKTLPLESIVLETDAPDIRPSWVPKTTPNEPSNLKEIAKNLAVIRGINISQVADITTKNALEILPLLAKLFTPSEVLL
jgi:TatD DNase family protein